MYTFQEIDFKTTEKIYECIRADKQSDAPLLKFTELSCEQQSKEHERHRRSCRAIYMRDSLIGWICLSSKPNATTHFAYGLFPEFRGKERMLEASRQFIREASSALEEAKSDSIIASVLPENSPSIRLLEKLGFRLKQEKIVEHKDINRVLTYRIYELKVSDFFKMTQ